MAQVRKITPCLWFEDQAEPAAKHYVAIFRNSRITAVTRFGDAGREIHGRPPGSVMTVTFELDGCPFTALNGGPQFQFNEAISFQVGCETQAEIDHFWERLGQGADPRDQQCGWLKDKFGVSWQVVPNSLQEMFADSGSAAAERVMAALMPMKKLDMAALQRAFDG